MREDISEKKAGGRYAAGFFLQLPALIVAVALRALLQPLLVPIPFASALAALGSPIFGRRGRPGKN
jgi:hypothetical protein